MTDQEAGDASQVEPLLDQIDMQIGQFTADGAYDGEPTYNAVTSHSADAAVIIPPRANAVDGKDTDPSSQRDRHIAAINADGRMIDPTGILPAQPTTRTGMRATSPSSRRSTR